MKRPNQPRVIRSVVTEKQTHHLASRKSETALRGLILISHRFSSLPRSLFRENTVDGNRKRERAAHAYMYACLHTMWHDVCRIASKGYHDFPMQIAKVAQPAKITVGNNAVDWEVELARASRETDNISLGRPLRRTIK